MEDAQKQSPHMLSRKCCPYLSTRVKELTSTSQKYFGDSLPVTQLSNIRGVKFSVRALGQAIVGGAFEYSFSKASLDNVSFQIIESQSVHAPVVAPLGAESRVLLQQAQMRTDSSFASYSEDVKAACPKTFGLFST